MASWGSQLCCGCLASLALELSAVGPVRRLLDIRARSPLARGAASGLLAPEGDRRGGAGVLYP